MALLLIEGAVLCFVLLMVCVVNIRNGPIGGVHYYEQPVKQRVVELGLISEKEIRKNRSISGCVLMAALIILAPLMVFKINGAESFGEGFLQLMVIYAECALFDKIFIDWYWVGHTKAWIIEGTEDLLPYINKQTWVKKIVAVIVLYPLLAGLLAWICTAI